MSKTCLCLTIFLSLLIQLTSEYNHVWRQDRKPKLMGDKVPMHAIMPTRRNIQRKIVNLHNFFRTKVVPKAANMLQMRWHKGAARAAQRWADRCMFLTHDDISGRHIKEYGSCGQNIFVSSQRVPWFFALETWFLEKDNFTYGGRRNDLKVVGHYTQMVWASTHQVGCGLSKCYGSRNSGGKPYYNYVCNYCPAGNRREQLGRPYKRGRPCGMCKNHCHAKRLCTNACHVSDVWANCKELYRMWSPWLCNKGQAQLENCKATCTCRDKIHD